MSQTQRKTHQRVNKKTGISTVVKQHALTIHPGSAKNTSEVKQPEGNLEELIEREPVTAEEKLREIVPHLSPSGAATWKQCPKKWWMKYVEKLPEPPAGEPAVLGNFVHDVLERLLYFPAKERTVKNTRIIAREVFEELQSDAKWEALGYDDQQARKFRQKAWATLEVYFSQVSPREVKPIAQELHVNLDIEGVPFMGFIDLVEQDKDTGEVVITDYKTGKPPSSGMPWSETERSEKMLQPIWYAAALKEMGEHAPSKARLMYFTVTENEEGKYIPASEEISIDITDEALDEARQELAGRWKDIGKAFEKGEAPPKTGPLCAWCPFVDKCPEGTEEATRRWNNVTKNGKRGVREDAPAVKILGLS